MNNFKEILESDKIYKGQCVFVYQQEKSTDDLKTVSENEKGKIKIIWNYDNKLFSHQDKVLSNFLNKKDVLLVSPYYSGRSTIGLICAIKKIFDESKYALYITPDEFNKNIQMNHLKSLLRHLNYEWLIEPVDIERNLTNATKFPGFIITDIQYLHSKLLPNYKNYPLFWNSLGLIIMDDFELFSGTLASNALFVFKRLNRIIEENEGKPQYLIFSKPIQDAEKIVKNLIGKNELVVINEDGRGLNSSTINLWVPSVGEVNEKLKSAENKVEINIERADLYDEIIEVAIKAIVNGLNTVIFYADIPLSNDDEIKYNKRISENIMRTNPNAKKGHWFIGDNLSGIHLQIQSKDLKWEDINLFIVAGFEGPLNFLRDNLVHLGTEGCLIYIFLPQMPYYQFYINHPEEIKPISEREHIRSEEQYSLFLLNENDIEIAKRHLLFFLYEGQVKEQKPENWHIAIKESLKNGYVSKKDDNILSLTDKGKKFVEEIIKLNGKDLYISSVQDSFYLYANDQLILLADPVSVANFFYSNAFVDLFNRRYLVDSVKENSINLSETDLFAMTSPSPDFKISDEQINKTLSIRDTLTFSLGVANLSMTIARYKPVEHYGISPANWRDVSPPLEVNVDASFLKISGFKDEIHAHTFAHLFFIALRTRFLCRKWEFPRFFISNNFIYFFTSQTLGNATFGNLMNENVLKDVLKRMFRIVADCPCQAGCPGCLTIIECPHESCAFDKIWVLELLGNLLDEQNVGDIIRFKKDGVDDQNMFSQVKNSVLKILETKAKMKIENPNNHLFFTKDECKKYPDYAGLCEGDAVKIKPRLIEESFFEVVAHEYTHNWQHEDNNLDCRFIKFNSNDIDEKNNILFNGKIFLEGQAMYGAIKVLDYYGLKDLISIYAKGGSDEYGAGAKLMLYLEKEFGLVKLLEILKSGKVNEKDVTPEILKEWYKKSGVYDCITDAGRKIADSSGLVCLTDEYLNKNLDDLARVSFHLQAIWHTKKKEETIGYLIADEKRRNVIWKHLKGAIREVNRSYGNKNEIPCLKCSQKDKETLEDVCILFKSIDYANKIREELGKEKSHRSNDRGEIGT